MTVKITESVKSDISTVIGYFTDEYFENNPEYYGGGSRVKCHTWSCFGTGDYQVRKEREFIEEVAAKNPGKYAAFHISWSNCN